MMRKSTKKIEQWLVISAILLVSYLSAIMYSDFSADAMSHAGVDSSLYIKMSQDFLANVGSPYALRIMSPFIVKVIAGLLNMGLNTSWLIVTCVATAVTLFLFFKFLNKVFKLNFLTSFTFVLFMAYTYNYTLFNYQDFWLVDPLNNLFWVLTFYMLFSKRYWYFLIAILIGSINKEVVMLLLPLYPIFIVIEDKSYRSKRLVYSVIYSLIVFLIYYSVRIVIIHHLGVDPGSYNPMAGGNESLVENIRLALSSQKEQFIVYNLFSFLWIVFLWGLRDEYNKNTTDSIKMLLASCYVILILIIFRTFATDTSRIIVMAAPLIITVCARFYSRFHSEKGLSWLWLLLFIYVSVNLGWVSKEMSIFSSLIALWIFIEKIYLSDQPESKTSVTI